ncbi:hypothetical protein H072_10707 [Dactylellina haptotyla CBS 200.50]|uniref:DUF7029 domain-containing protein n=1 Tax=Dactylellina haptotyla (strain CBS 200.50) TaxID=1284197 RepID=S8BKL5_DACHA|nr:hypothetical protein H072_10707 [Dactylellina haptotyla CBS 200.50]
MVSSRLLPVILSFGWFGTQAAAGIHRSDFSSVPVEQSAGEHKLLPIRAEHLYPHLQKRSDDLSKLHLQDKATLFYGKPAGGFNLRLANITAIRPDSKHPLLVLEDFDDLAKNITCQGQGMSLEFQNKDVMKYAIKKWDWVNQDDKDYFFLVSHHHHSGCNPKEERKPHKVVAVKYDEQKSIASLTLGDTTWDEALGDFRFEFKTMEHPALKLAKRRSDEETAHSTSAAIALDGLCSAIKGNGLNILGCKEDGEYSFDHMLTESAKNALSAVWSVIPEFDLTNEADFSWGKDDPSSRLEITDAKGVLPSVGGADPWGAIQGFCVGCYLEGKLEYSATGGRNAQTKETELIIAFLPKIKGRIQVEVSGKLEVAKEFNFLGELISYFLKAEGVDGIISIAPQFLNGPGVLMKAGVHGNFTVGFDMDTGSSLIMLKASSDADVSLQTKELETFQADPIFKADTIKTRSEVIPYFRLGIGAGATFFKDSTIRGKLGAWAGLTPQIVSAIEMGFESQGMCDDKPEMGAKFETSFKVNVGYTTTAGILSDSDSLSFANDLFGTDDLFGQKSATNTYQSKTLYEKTFEACKAVSA